MKILPAIILSFLLCGCVSVVKYPPSGEWNQDVKTLGLVKTKYEGWPLALHSPPPEYTFYSALRSKAASQFSVPIYGVVLGETSVSLLTEIDGTIRGWDASAVAGFNPNLTNMTAPIIEQTNAPVRSPKDLRAR